ncbi:class I SAM-dependent methyltransferase [Roseibium sp.]|uniref:class I SAM-dependent methyltransferase n=1 Tax=Roseibium sp. TaxID=1936156 RepID=UPI003A96AF7D
MTRTRNTTGDVVSFARAWLRAPLRTGAIAPSSPELARHMVFSAAPAKSGPVIELGPGTGIVTDCLLAAGIEERDLVLIELDPDFAANLKRKYPQAKVIETDAFAFVRNQAHTGETAAAIISSLPLYVYPKVKRQKLCEDALRALGPGGRLVQFTYGPVSPISPPAHIDAFRSRRIWGNLPPAVVWTYQTKTFRAHEPGPLNIRDKVETRESAQ